MVSTFIDEKSGYLCWTDEENEGAEQKDKHTAHIPEWLRKTMTQLFKSNSLLIYHDGFVYDWI